VKYLFLTLIFTVFTVHAREYSHKELQDYVGYHSIYEHPNINRDQITFLSHYTNKIGPWHKEVNDYLRTGYWFGWETERLDKSISSIDKLMNESPKLPKGLLLFRGQMMDFLGRHYSIGEEFNDMAYYSTTTSLSTARKYSLYDHFSFVMVIYFADEEGKGLVLNNFDDEVLLQRGLTYKVMDSAKGQSRRYGLVQICPKRGCEATITNKKVRKWWNNYKDENLTDDRNNNPTFVLSGPELAESDSLPDADV
jgi:hypothetical protein